MIKHQEKQEQILNASNSTFRMRAYIGDTKYLDETDRDEQYYFTFYPATNWDYSRLDDSAELAVQKVKEHSSRYNQDAFNFEAKYIKGQERYVSQFFAPKVTTDRQENPEHLRGTPCELTMFWKDDKFGGVYLNCSYLEFEDTKNGITEPQAEPCDMDW